MASQTTTFNGKRHTRVPRANSTTGNSESSSSSSSSSAMSSSTGTPPPQAAGSTSLQTLSTPLSSVASTPTSTPSFSPAPSSSTSAAQGLQTLKSEAHSDTPSRSGLDGAPAPHPTEQPPPPPPQLSGRSSNSASGSLVGDPSGLAEGSLVTVDSAPPSTADTQAPPPGKGTSSSLTFAATDSVVSVVTQQSISTSAVVVTVVAPTSTATFEPPKSSPTAHPQAASTSVVVVPVPVSTATPTSTSLPTSVPSASSLDVGPLPSSSSTETQPGIFVPLSGSLSNLPSQSQLAQASFSSITLTTSEATSTTGSLLTAETGLAPPTAETSSSLISVQPSEVIGASSSSSNGPIHDTTADGSASNRNGVDSKKVAAISAGAVAGFVGLLLAVGLVIFCLKRRRRRMAFTSPNPAHLEKFDSPFGGTFGGGRFSIGLKSLINKPLVAASGIRGRFHSRGPSSTALMSEQRWTGVGGAKGAFKSRRSLSEPQRGFAVLSRPAKHSPGRQVRPSPQMTQQQSPGRPGTAQSAGPIYQYQMPWQDSPGPTPMPKTWRVVNLNTADNTPAPGTPGAGTAPQRNSYFGIQYPAKAVASTAAISHRRSASLQLSTMDDPFIDRPASNDSASHTSINTSTQRNGAHHVRNFSRVQLLDSASTTSIADRHTRGSNVVDYHLSRASLALPSAITSERMSREHDPVASPQDRELSTVSRSSESAKMRHDSSVSGSTVPPENFLPGIDFSNDNTPGISPITDPTTVSRNTSNASGCISNEDRDQRFSLAAQMVRSSYDPFNHNNSQQNSEPAVSGLVRDNHVESRRSVSTNSDGISLDPKLLLDSSKLTPSRRSTQDRGETLTDRPALSRQTSALSNDPFDLDRPEVLGYTPGAMKTRFDTVGRSQDLGRSDSDASRGSVAGRGSRRRSTFQGWSYIDEKYSKELSG